MSSVLPRVLLLIAISACAAFAQDAEYVIRIDVTAMAPKDERWLELRTKNFLVVGNDNEERLRKAAADLELFREQFASLFPRARAISSVPTTVVVFRNEDTFRPYRRVKNEVPEDVNGYFQAGSDVNYLVLSGSAPNRSIYREYIRSLMPDSMGIVPEWFHLGLPEYFTTFHVTWDGDDRWAQVGTRDREFNELLRDKDLIPLKSFFETKPSGTVDSDHRDSTYYAESWALTHYLLQTGHGVNLGNALKFFRAMSEGQPAGEAFPDAFDMDIKQFEGETDADGDGSGFRQYILESRSGKTNPVLDPNLHRPPRTAGGWNTSLAGYSLDQDRKIIQTFYYTSELCGVPGPDKSGMSYYPCTHLISIPVNYDSIWAEVSQFPVRMLSEAETDFHRGNLMLHIGRDPEAAALLQLSLRIDPNVAPSLSALGFLRTRQGQLEEARQLLAAALALAPTDYFAHYYNALAAEKAGGPAETVAAELRKTIELAPQFVEASQKLADLDASLQENLEEAVDIIRDALLRSPGRESLASTLAGVLAANHVDELPEGRAPVQEFFSSASETRPAKDIPISILADASSASTPDQKSLRGKLISVECMQGLTLVVESDGRTVRFHSNTPDKVEFLRFTNAEGNTLSCGDTASIPVFITYRPASSDAMLGDPIRVEFVEDAR